MLILFTVIMFQPIYNMRSTHQKIFGLLPSLFTKAAPVTSKIAEHTPETIAQLKKFLLNMFVVLCFAWVTILLYEAIPRFGIPILYSRQVTAFLVFCFFASFPFYAAMKALKKIIQHAVQKERVLRKRFAFISSDE